MALSRRNFIKASAAFSAAAALGGCTKGGDDVFDPAGSAGNQPDLRPTRKVYSTCPVECLTHSLNCQLVGNEVIRVEPTKKSGDIYFTTACARGMSRMQFLTENRAATPMKRIKKGSEYSELGVQLKDNSVDEWVSISWEQALSEIAAPLREYYQRKKQNIKDAEKGIMVWTGSGNMGPIVNTLIGNFFDHISPNRATKLGNSCCAGVDAGMVPVYGKRSIDTRDTIRDSKCIINWGNNPADTTNTYWKFVIDAKLNNNAKIITIDPRYSTSAEKSDIWVQLKPGTDTLFGIGMLRWIFNQDTTGTVKSGTYIDTDLLKYRTNAPFLVDISEIMNGETGQLIDKAYNNIHKVSLKKDAENNYLVWNGVAEEIAQENKGRNNANPNPNQNADLYYTDLSKKVTTVYQLLRALYAGDLLTGAQNPVDAELAKLHDPVYTETKITEITGIQNQSLIEETAKAYASTNGASMIIENMGGAQRTESAGHECAMHCILSLITGNVGNAGSGVDDTSGWSSSAAGLQANLDDVTNLSLGTSMTLLKKAEGKTNPHNIPFGTLGRRALAAAKNEPYDTYLKKEGMADKDPHIKFWYLATSSLLTQFPNTDAIKEALRRSECVVTAKPTWNTDADYSDYFLPVTTPFEYEDIGAANRNKYIQVMEPGVVPYGQSLSDQQILRRLAKLVFDDPEIIAGFDHDDADYPKDIVENPANNIINNGLASYEQLKEVKVFRPACYSDKFIPLRNLEFYNDLKRANIYIYQWQDTASYPYIDLSPNPARDLYKGPFPRYVPAMQSHQEFLPDFPYLDPDDEVNSAFYQTVPADMKKIKLTNGVEINYQQNREMYPLCNVQYKVARTVHSSFTGLPWIREAFGEKGVVLMNTADAAARGISDGDAVYVTSNIGTIERIAKVSDQMMYGVTAVENGWWDDYGKISSSTIGVELPGPMSNAHTHNNTLVQIVKK